MQVHSPLKIIAVSSLGCLLLACSHTEKTSKDGLRADTRVNTASMGRKTNPDADMLQITPKQQELAAMQIASNADKKLTVEQLNVYVDRCQPGSTLPIPEGLDCSDLRLRMKRVFRSDDKVAEALVTLGRLGQNDRLQGDPEGDLNYGQLNPGSIAGQVLQDGSSANIPEPTNEFTNFLDANGLSLSDGAIILTTDGGR